MRYIIASVSYKAAPIELRERIALSTEQLPAALNSLLSATVAQEAVITCTCNRTELCLSVDAQVSLAEISAQVYHWFYTYHRLSEQNTIENHTVFYEHEAAVEHLLKVASGLDSMILGESQILGQLKSAYAAACAARSTGATMNRLFQHCFTSVKDIRTQTAISQHPISVAYAAIRLAQQIFSDLHNNTALLIGAGDTIELTAKHLCRQGVSNLIIANRTVERAQRLTDKFGGQPIKLSQLSRYLPQSDIIISSTASPVPVLGKGAVEQALKLRKHRPFFMVDLAVPRDIEPQISELADVFLYTVDDLHGVISDNLRQRQLAATHAAEMIDDYVSQFMQRLRALDAVEIVCHYRRKAEHIRDIELQKAMNQLQNGRDPALVLQQLAQSLTNKFMHHPSAQLRLAAEQQQSSQLAWARQLLGLNESSNKAGNSE